MKPIDSVEHIPGESISSSLTMNVVPAKITGVKRIVCVTPPAESPYFIALLKELKINEVYL